MFVPNLLDLPTYSTRLAAKVSEPRGNFVEMQKVTVVISPL